MTPEELTLEQLKIEAQTKRVEARMGVWKVVVGTGIVGLAAAFFPFAQESAKVVVQYMINTDNNEFARSRDFRELVKTMRENVAKGREDEQISLSTYFYFLSEDDDEAARWLRYRDYLTEQQTERIKAEIEASVTAATSESAEAVARAEATVRALAGNSTAGALAEAEPVAADATFKTLLDRLSAENAATRREARTALGGQGVAMVGQAMKILNGPEPLSYRTRVGLIVALTEMMRENKANRAGIIGSLSPEDLEVLVMAATDSDRTIRIYASEFLFDLGDPRAFDIAVRLWDSTTDGNGRFNLALIMKGTAPYLSDKSASTARLRNLGGEIGQKTGELIRQAIALVE